MSSGSQQTRGEARGEGQRHGGRVAAGHGDAARPGERVALPAAAGDAAARAGRRARSRRAGCRRTSVHAVVVGEPEVGAAVDDDDVRRAAAAASAAEWPCGRARKTTSWPASTSGVVSSRTRSASGMRCGWMLAERLAGVRAPRSARRSRPRGARAAAAGALRRRTRSPRPLPLVIMCMTIQPVRDTHAPPASSPSGSVLRPTGSTSRERVGCARSRPEPARRRAPSGSRPCRRRRARSRPDQASRPTRSRAARTRSVTSIGSVHSVRPACASMPCVMSVRTTPGVRSKAQTPRSHPARWVEPVSRASAVLLAL